ncbi:hypothetical protein NLI96_g7074 [Meripilus lineatus]|uniref:Retrotransposon gag domain-containing protein n=1 Tax=Meripilus lineatus TaxID=2056292 RepID=A0AAD5V026_9APHY|nr:hypothetical protein NLI96_g7074 [Physisporinus lineatus]
MATPTKQNLSIPQSRAPSPPGLTLSGNRRSDDRGDYRNTPLVPPGLPPLGNSSNFHQGTIVPGKSPPPEVADHPHNLALITAAQRTPMQASSLRSQSNTTTDSEDRWVQMEGREDRIGHARLAGLGTGRRPVPSNYRIYFRNVNNVALRISENVEGLAENMTRMQNDLKDTRASLKALIQNLRDNESRYEQGLDAEEFKLDTTNPRSRTQVEGNETQLKPDTFHTDKPLHRHREPREDRRREGDRSDDRGCVQSGGSPGRDPPGGPPYSGNPGGNGSSNDGEDRGNSDKGQMDNQSSGNRRTRSMTPFPERDSRGRTPNPTHRGDSTTNNRLFARDTEGRVVDNSLTWISETIDEMLGEELKETSRSIKMKDPERYDGTDDLDVFDGWLMDVVRWMALMQLGGSKRDRLRLITLGQCLSKNALQWYNTEVASPSRIHRTWTFKDTVCDLFDHFIHKVSGKKASNKFKNVKYDPRKGASHLFTEMRKYARRMIETPSEYDQSVVFVEALPEEIRKGLRIARQITEERNSLEEIYRNTMEIEEAINNDRWSHEVSDKHERKKTYPDEVRGDRKQHEGSKYSPQPAYDRGHDRFKSTNRREESQKSREPDVRIREEPQRDEKKSSSSSTTAQRSHSRQDSQRDERKDIPRLNKSQALCLKCGVYGHAADDDECPLRPKPALRRVEEVPSDSESYSEDTSHSGNAEETGSERESSERDAERRRYTRFGRRNPRRRSSESESSYNSDQSLRASVAESEEGYDVEGYGSDESAYTSGGEHATESNHTDGEEDSASFRAMSVATDMLGNLNGDDPLVERRSRPKQASGRLMAYIEINGKKALAMFDSGSSIDVVDHEFARLAYMKPFRLRKPVSLRLGTRENRSRIDFGTYTQMSINGVRVEEETYLDIVDISRYDIVFGAPLMSKYGMCLDFEHRVVRTRGGDVIKSISLQAVQEIRTEMVETMETHRERQTNTKMLPPQTRSQSFCGGGRPSVELPVIPKPNTHQVKLHSKIAESPALDIPSTNPGRGGRSHKGSQSKNLKRGPHLVEHREMQQVRNETYQISHLAQTVPEEMTTEVRSANQRIDQDVRMGTRDDPDSSTFRRGHERREWP